MLDKYLNNYRITKVKYKTIFTVVSSDILNTAMIFMITNNYC